MGWFGSRDHFAGIGIYVAPNPAKIRPGYRMDSHIKKCGGAVHVALFWVTPTLRWLVK
jgi:hypothetical protein